MTQHVSSSWWRANIGGNGRPAARVNGSCQAGANQFQWQPHLPCSDLTTGRCANKDWRHWGSSRDRQRACPIAPPAAVRQAHAHPPTNLPDARPDCRCSSPSQHNKAQYNNGHSPHADLFFASFPADTNTTHASQARVPAHFLQRRQPRPSRPATSFSGPATSLP